MGTYQHVHVVHVVLVFTCVLLALTPEPAQTYKDAFLNILNLSNLGLYIN